MAVRPRERASPPSHASYRADRRTAVVLSGEATAAAYLAGALKALDEAGLKIDLLVGKGVGGLVAAFGAIGAGERLYGEKGLLRRLGGRRPWRLRAPYRLAALAFAASFVVFMAPALVAAVAVAALPFVLLARLVAPGATGAALAGLEGAVVELAGRLEPVYLRAVAFPIATFFALAVAVWIVPRLLRRSALRWPFGEGVVELGGLEELVLDALWEAVRGASTDRRPADRRILGRRYHELLAANAGAAGFRELLLYALDLDAGEEVVFAWVKERFRGGLDARGPLSAPPVRLDAEGAAVLADALVASLRPAGLAPSVPLERPARTKDGGEVHRFVSSGHLGESALADAVAAGAEQIVYVSGAAADADAPGEGVLGRLAAATVRASLARDLRWSEEARAAPDVWVVRPAKARLGVYELGGRTRMDGRRLEPAALIAEGERDTIERFLELVGEEPSWTEPAETEPPGGTAPWEGGPREL